MTTPLTRSYLKFILIITITFLGLSLTARALGMTQPPNPALRGFTEGCEDKPQPCWYGIVFGITTVNESISLLERHGFSLLEGQYAKVYGATGFRVLDRAGSKEDSCQITIPMKLDTPVEEIVFDSCLDVHLLDLRQLIEPVGYGTYWTCSYGKVLGVEYPSLEYITEADQFMPPNNLTSIDTFILRLPTPRNTPVDMTAVKDNMQSKPLHWRYLYLWLVDIATGCFEG